MLNTACLVDFVEDVVRVLFGCCREDGDFVVGGEVFEEFLCEGTNVEQLFGLVEVDEGFVQIQYQVVFVGQGGR
jgi:hypothetical protein